MINPDQLPDPLVPAEVDLRDFAFMPLDVRRLLTSETWIEGADNPRAAHASMSLWCEAWHQVPAGSLPDNDKVLARLAMCDAKTWRKVREAALRGFVRCSDGRLYHPVVCEKAIESWHEKLAYRERKQSRKEAARKAAAARWGEQSKDDASAMRNASDTHANGNADAMRDQCETHAQRNAIAMPKGTGTGTGTGIDSSEPNGSGGAPPDDPVKALFDFGVSVLTAADVPERQARSLVGKWRGRLGDDGALMNMLMTARKQAAVEPVAYLEKALQRELTRRRSGGVTPLGVGG